MSSIRNTFDIENLSYVVRAHLLLIKRDMAAAPELLRIPNMNTIPALEAWMTYTLDIIKQDSDAIDNTLAMLNLPEALKKNLKDTILTKNKIHLQFATPLVAEYAYRAHYYKIPEEMLLTLTIYLCAVLADEQLDGVFTQTLLDTPQDSTDASYLEIFMKMGRDFNTPLRSQRNCTPFQFIIYAKSTGLAEYFLKKQEPDFKIDYTARDLEGTTALILAAKMMKVSLIETMLLDPEARATINEKDIYGRTALHYACTLGQEELILKLQDTDGIDMHVVDNDGKSASEYLCTDESFASSVLQSVDINPARHPLALHNNLAYFSNSKICAPDERFQFDENQLSADTNTLQQLLTTSPVLIAEANIPYLEIFMKTLLSEAIKSGMALPADLKALWGKNLFMLTKIKNYPPDAPATLIDLIMKNRQEILQHVVKTIERDSAQQELEAEQNAAAANCPLQSLGLFSQSAVPVDINMGSPSMLHQPSSP
jgi:hypothetical protein